MRRRRDGEPLESGGRADDGPHNPLFAAAEKRPARLAVGGSEWQPLAGLPDVYIAMGQTAENVRISEGVSRADMDEFAVASHTRALAARDVGFFDREITPVVTRPAKGHDRRRTPAWDGRRATGGPGAGPLPGR